MDIDSVKDYLTAELPRAMDRLESLVTINSFGRNPDGIDRVGDACIDLFAPLGFRPRKVASVLEGCGSHVILTRPGTGDDNMLLMGHIDTVFTPEEEEENDFAWREEGDRIYGPGTMDMKGGIVLLHMVLCALQKFDKSLFESVTWNILLNATEEGACPDFPGLAHEHVDARTLAALTFEPSHYTEVGENETSILEARRGSGRFRIEAFGRAAHSGAAHERGASAVREIARRVEEIESWTDYDRGLTFNVGTIHGGRVINGVPAHAWCSVDMRSFTLHDCAEGTEKIRAIAGEGSVRSAADGLPVRVEVTELPAYPPWEKSERNQALVETYLRVAASLGMAVKPISGKASSDSNHVGNLVPTLCGVGPLGGNAHCARHAPEKGLEQEWMSRSSFVPRALLNYEVIRLVVTGASPPATPDKAS